MSTVEAMRRDRAAGRGARSTAILLSIIVALLVVGGGAFAVVSSRTAPPALPAVPVQAHLLWTRQTADMIDGNQVLTVALYRAAGSPSQVITAYQRALPGRGTAGSRFDTIVRSASPDDLPTALQHLPSAFADGQGAHRSARYTFLQYADDGSDIGIAVDLRRPRGPTLLFVEMLSQ